ncbi:MAG: Mu-like prophage major head subunit gpT family protein [Nitrospira sp.]|nr:Mu-like prophage major head subunit gpT family protein [Nitrospira sp.]
MGGSGLGSRAIIGTFYETLEQAIGSTWMGRLAMAFSSDQESETYKWLGASPAVREWVGERLAKGLRENGLTIVNKTFEATLKILVDDLRRDKTGQIMLRIKEMADRVAAHPMSMISTLINNGGAATNGLAYDGQYFFDTDHVEGDSGTLKNDLAAGDYAVLNVGAPTAPTSNEMADAILAVLGHFYSFKDDQGEPINEMAKQFLVMVPFNMWGAAQTAVSANLLNTGSGGRDNPLTKMGVSIDVVANTRLTAQDKFAMFRTDGRTKPFIEQTEEAVKISAIGEGSEYEFQNNAHLYGVKVIRNVGYGMWQQAIRATLS